MIGNEQILNVYLGEHFIATLTLKNDQLEWHYRKNWQESGYPISPHLPLINEIPNINVQRFLRNLLPEGHGIEALINIFHLSRSNTFGLIQALGMDIPGSLIIRSSTETVPPAASFRPITETELEAHLDNRDEFNLIIWDGKPRLSVAGVQDKINVILNKEGTLGFGEGPLCSTHILKFEKQKLSHLVLNEFFTLKLAKHCGLNVANAQLVRYGKHPALLVERFDRQFISMTEVKRRHVIDGCQALNLPPDYKYERNFGSHRDVSHIREGASLLKLFTFANQCETPARVKQQILDWTLFNLLIFNCDAHGKNISFFVGSNGISVAPFYDLVNIKMYPHFEHEMAMAFGDEFDGSNINAYQLADFSEVCGIGRPTVVAHLKRLIKKLTTALSIEMKDVIKNNEEKAYLDQYKHLVQKRCKHLLEQADEIVSVKL